MTVAEGERTVIANPADTMPLVNGCACTYCSDRPAASSTGESPLVSGIGAVAPGRTRPFGVTPIVVPATVSPSISSDVVVVLLPVASRVTLATACTRPTVNTPPNVAASVVDSAFE